MILETTEAGRQGVIPGAERIGMGELARRKAAEPLKPAAPQRPLDFGLFGSSAAQIEMFTTAREKR